MAVQASLEAVLDPTPYTFDANDDHTVTVDIPSDGHTSDEVAITMTVRDMRPVDDTMLTVYARTQTFV